MKTQIDVKIRPYAGEEDVPKFVSILNSELEADGVPNRESVEDNLAFVRHATDSFDPKRDLSIAEIDGEIDNRVQHACFSAAIALASGNHHVVAERWRGSAAQLYTSAVHPQLSLQRNPLVLVRKRTVAAER